MEQSTIRIMSIYEVPKFYPGLSSWTVRRLVQRGELPCKRTGRKYLITSTAVEDWLRGGQAKAEETGN